MEYFRLDAFEAASKELQAAGVRFLVVGGLAVIAYGSDRVTIDLDFVIQLHPENVHKAFEALKKASYFPTVPIKAEQFSDPETRNGWIRDKGMIVLSFWSDRFPQTRLDVFVTEPFDFDKEYDTGLVQKLTPELELHYPTIATLIKMKKLANRSKDLQDIEFLERYGNHG